MVAKNPFEQPQPSHGAIGTSRACGVLAYMLLTTLVFRWCAEAYASVPTYLIPMLCLTVLLGLCMGASVFIRPPDFGAIVGDCCCRNDELTALCSLGMFLIGTLSMTIFLAGLDNTFRFDVLMVAPNATGSAQNLWRMAPTMAPGRQGFYLSNGYVALERQVQYADKTPCCAPVYANQDEMFGGGPIIAWAMAWNTGNGTLIPNDICPVMPWKNLTNVTDWRPLYGRGGLCGVLHPSRPYIGIGDSEATLFKKRFQGTQVDTLNLSYTNRSTLPALVFKKPADLRWDTVWHQLSYAVGSFLLAAYFAGEAVGLLAWACCGGVDLGKCTQEYEDGSVYHGQFWRRRFHGYGRMRWSDGEEYDGNYHLGAMHGQGAYTHMQGGRYEGQFQDGLRHGYGVFAFPDGSLYEGQWRQDKPAGEGSVVYPNGRIIRGLWEGGQQDLHGMARQANSGAMTSAMSAAAMPPLPEMRAELPRGLPPPPRGHPEGLKGSAGRLPVLPPYGAPPGGAPGGPTLPGLPALPPLPEKRATGPPRPPIGAPNV